MSKIKTQWMNYFMMFTEELSGEKWCLPIYFVIKVNMIIISLSMVISMYTSNCVCAFRRNARK